MRNNYRAWDKKKEEMFDVVAINWELERVYSTWNDENGNNLYVPMSEATLMQSISVPDDKGDEVYEGDVIVSLREGFGETVDEYDTHVIKWDYYYTGYSPFQDDYSYPSDGFVKIGNIFEDEEYKHYQEEYFDSWGKELSSRRRKNNEWM